MPSPIIVEVEGTIPASLERTFAVFMPIDLRQILRGFGPLPPVVAVEKQTGAWDSVGESRVIRLADDSTMKETLVTVEAPQHFGYRIDELTSALRHLVSHFDGAWYFEAREERGGEPRTGARWRYAFTPRSGWTRLPALLILSLFWKPYMKRALAHASAIAGDTA
jgi:hypothetical protein